MKSVGNNFNKKQKQFFTILASSILVIILLSAIPGQICLKIGFQKPITLLPNTIDRERVYLGISNFICFDQNLSELQLTGTCSLITEVKISDIKRA